MTPMMPVEGLPHVQGASPPPLADLAIGQLPHAAALSRPDGESCVFHEAGVRWSWRQLLDESARLAG